MNVLEGGAQERGKRPGTENLPGIMGMAQALKDACGALDETAGYVTALRDRLIQGLSQIPHSVLNGDPVNGYVTALRDRLIQGLSQIPHSVLNGDPVNRLPGNVSFCFEGIEGESLLLLLDSKGIRASSGSACTSGSLDPSHVLLAIGRPHEIAHGSLRLSLCEDNTPEQVDYIIESVKEVVGYLRSISPVWRDLVTGKRQYITKE